MLAFTHVTLYTALVETFQVNAPMACSSFLTAFLMPTLSKQEGTVLICIRNPDCRNQILGL